MDHEKINYDLIVAVLEYIVVGEHEVCWTALSLNYSSLFYSSSLANKYFLGPAFLEHKINNFLNRYQRRAPVSEIIILILSLSVLQLILLLSMWHQLTHVNRK